MSSFIITTTIYVLAFASNSHAFIYFFKHNTLNTFEVKFFGELEFFVSWKIAQSEDGISNSQKRYANNFFGKYRMVFSNASLIAMNSSVNPKPTTKYKEILHVQDHSYYKMQLGVLFYLLIGTRPDK